MAYTVKIIRNKEQQTTGWSGGTTTEVSIYPADAVYRRHNFLWRLSSARVDVDESTFTTLPGISRVLMVIDGVLALRHEGHHSVQLQPFEQDRFSGDWQTTSTGKVRDFNLMMSSPCQGQLSAITVEKQITITIFEEINPDLQEMVAFYCVYGGGQVVVNKNEVIELGEGDFLLFHGYGDKKSIVLELRNFVGKKAKFIRADMQF